MTCILIAYDLHKLGQRYTQLRNLVKQSFPVHWNCLESTFIVKTEMSVVQVRDLVMTALDSNDELLVVALQPAVWAAYGFSKNCSDWLLEEA